MSRAGRKPWEVVEELVIPAKAGMQNYSEIMDSSRNGGTGMTGAGEFRLFWHPVKENLTPYLISYAEAGTKKEKRTQRRGYAKKTQSMAVTKQH